MQRRLRAENLGALSSLQMANLNLVINVLAGCLVLACGLHAIIFRQIEVGEDEEIWFYGWRAVLIGCICVCAACVLFFELANHRLVHLF